MPMGGGGTRFGNHGFNLPKPLIPLQGKPFLYWATKCVMEYIPVEDITFIVLKEHIEKFGIDEKIREFFPESRLAVIDHVLDGAVLTCLEGAKLIDDDLPLLFNDCDHAFTSREFADYCKAASFSDCAGALLTFESDNPAYSYVRFDTEGRVIGTIEKEVVSNKAICGAYYFGNKSVFMKASEKYLTQCSYKEYFVSGVYNILAAEGENLRTFGIDEHISFGTPDEYEVALKDERLTKLIH